LDRLAATKYEAGKQGLGFHLIFVEGFDERCCIPSGIYCMSLPRQPIFFVAQNIILFEHPIQISLWARMIRHDGKMRKIYVHNFDLRRVFTTLSFVLICHSQDSLHAPDLNPCAPPDGVRDIVLSCTSHRRNKQQYRPLRFPVEVSYLPPALPSVRPPARLSARWSVSPSVRPACLPSVRSVRRSARPSRQPIRPAGRRSVRPSAGPSVRRSARPSGPPVRPAGRQSVGPLVCAVSPSARPAVSPSVRPPVHQSVRPLVRPVHPSARPAASPSVRSSVPSARPAGRPSARPPVCPACRPSARPAAGSSVRRSASPSGPPVRSSARLSVGPLVPPVRTTDLIYSEEQQIYSELFLARHVYRHMSEKLRTILECHSQHD
jgi:hypothetical protein